MELKITTIYCVSEELLKALNYRDDSQSQMSSSS